MRKTPSETNAGLEGFFAEGLRRAQAAFHVRGKSMQADDMAVQEAVQAGAMAGAYAGAVAGAMAGALSARGGGVASVFRSPEKPDKQSKEKDKSRSGGHAKPPQLPDEPSSPQRSIHRNPSAGNVSTASGDGDEHDLELELAKTLTIDEYITKSGIEQHIEEPKESVPPPPKRQPSLYEKNTDIDGEEDVDPRVGLTLDRMNEAGDDVNNKELALTRAKSSAQRIQDDEKKRCQDAYDKLPAVIKEILPYLHKQALVNQQQGKAQKAFVEYQEAHDAHAASKLAIKAIEPELMAGAGRSTVDTDLLERYSDLASKVVEAEAEKLRADKQHALEARRLSNLLKELAASKQYFTKEHVIAAQPYFAVKSRAEDSIKAAVENIVVCQKSLREAKRVYQDAMEELDRISNEIHEKRQEDKRRRQAERDRRQRDSLDRRRIAEEQQQVEEAAGIAAAQIAAAVKIAMSPQQLPSTAEEAPNEAQQPRALDRTPSEPAPAAAAAAPDVASAPSEPALPPAAPPAATVPVPASEPPPSPPPAAAPAEPDLFDFSASPQRLAAAEAVPAAPEPAAEPTAVPAAEVEAEPPAVSASADSLSLSLSAVSVSSLAAEASDSAPAAQEPSLEPATETAAAASPAASSRRDFRRMDSDPFGIHAGSAPAPPVEPVAEGREDDDLC